jgi:hypothetical protein
MTSWQKPTFEELAMNAEIGAYQPEYGDDERSDEPFVQVAPSAPLDLAVPAPCG